MDGEHANMDCVIRNLSPEDLNRLVAIDRQITNRTRRSWYEGKLKRVLQESDVHLSLGAECDGLLVGAMLCSVQYGEFGVPEPTAILDTVLVDREFARRGVATAMFDQLLVKNLRALRIEKLRTEVAWDERELLGFFQRQGFSPIPRLVLETTLDGDA